MARREGGRTTAVQDASRESRPQAGPAGFGLRQSSGALAWAREEHGRNHSGRRTPQVGKAVEDYRSPRRFATIEAAGKSARFWSAPALWRFLHTTARTPPVCPSFARQETISPSAHK